MIESFNLAADVKVTSRPTKNGSIARFRLSHRDSVRLGDIMYSSCSLFMRRKRDVYDSGRGIELKHSRWTPEETALAMRGVCPSSRSKAAYFAKLALLKRQRRE